MAQPKNNRFNEDFDITKEEINRIGEALKKEEFRKLLNNYFDEVNDPGNKALFQKEVTEFERERGVDVTFIHPESGYVIKSSVDGKKKAFINICSNENVNKPSSTVSDQRGSPGLNWSIPYLLGQPRDDLDKKKQRCTVYDVVYHPDALYLAKKNIRIKELVNDIALTAVEDTFNVKIDRKNVVFPKLQYKGMKVATIIRKKRDDYAEKSAELDDILPNYPYAAPPDDNTPKISNPRPNIDANDNCLYTTPKFIIKHRKELEMQEYTYEPDAKFHSVIPSELVVEIDLPLIKSATDVQLDILGKDLTLISEKPAKYKLNIKLPYLVEDEKGNAKFDKTKKKLTVTLPVKKCPYSKPDFIREDSGIESDPNQNNCSSSEEDIQKSVEILQLSDVENNVNYLRTSEEIKSEFLNPSFHYTLPKVSLTVNNYIISYTMYVKNIEPTSVAHQFHTSGVHVKFSTLGSGFFPIHYAIYLSIPKIKFDKTSLKIDVWDNCLGGELKFERGTENIDITTYFVGTSLDNLEEKRIIEEKKLTFPSDSSSSLESNEDDGINKEKDENLTKASCDDIPPTFVKPLAKITFKNRTLSESSELPESFAANGSVRRSILKCSRSLSESHTDDYNTWSSLDSESHEDLAACKKTVRFNDVVSKKIFRANSSILGQKKKNEKRARNKKKAHERIISGTVKYTSEESETDRETDIDSLSDVSDVSSDDNNGTSSTKIATVVPSSKRHRRRGAKNQRKAAATAKQNHYVD